MPLLSRLSGAGLALALLAGAAGCNGLDEASAAGLTRDDLITEMADQLAAGSALSYTATYQLTGGDTATVTRAQRPARAAYVYPGGRLIVTPTATFRCTGDEARPTCAEDAPDPAAPAALDGDPLVTPEAARTMLDAAALDGDVQTQPHDTTIAGRHATCLSLAGVAGTPASAFDLCVTNEGALASFAATIAGKRTDVVLTAYDDETPPDAFLLPARAEVTGKK